ncbi:RpiB/LacA/LacB family sugar-phosphate isomerase [Patescibacteria group bacterium]|nr:RpiB/LacA/LacB family sugar-phosphate isomerase [Patescibacteria group bacterium]
MLIYIGADHRGFNLKESVKDYLKSSGYEVIDVGSPQLVEGDDYPDVAALAARKVSMDPSGCRAVLVCGSGVGVDIVANKFPHVRSVLGFNADQVMASRNDDDTNVLCLAADYIEDEDAKRLVAAWMPASFSGEDRHRRRLKKIDDIETRNKMM